MTPRDEKGRFLKGMHYNPETEFKKGFKGGFSGFKKSNIIGEFLRSDGYWMIYCPDNPRAYKNGYLFKHTYIWEQSNQKPLPKGWVVHHINGIKSDNRPVNLCGLPDKSHKRIFEVKAKRIQELEALLKKQGQLI